jgi:hypothetical protein
MKITNRGNIDSGAGKAGFGAYKKGLDWSVATERWVRSKKNSLWIKAALTSFREAGGVVPEEKLNRRAYRRMAVSATGMHSSHKRK